MKYEMTIGLETHSELSTKTKIFCGCSTEPGAQPNSHCCPVCMGLPGALPVLNGTVVEYAVRAGLALHSTIAHSARQDRKNYFYPDLPKAYQISQLHQPLCDGGYLDIGTKRVHLTRIHIEEDAGKLIHGTGGETLIDLNRAGIPLIEIVTEPDLHSAKEVRAYLEKLILLLREIGVSEAKMEAGSLRTDVNLSVRPEGSDVLGERVEIKNMNSLKAIERAIEFEPHRQNELNESGREVRRDTRRFDPATGKTYPMRDKEDANDYRYFPDPDLPAIALKDFEIERARWRGIVADKPVTKGVPAQKEDIRKIGDPERLSAWAKQAVSENPELVDAIQAGRLNAANALMGAAMRLSGGKADAKALNEMFLQVMNDCVHR